MQSGLERKRLKKQEKEQKEKLTRGVNNKKIIRLIP